MGDHCCCLIAISASSSSEPILVPPLLPLLSSAASPSASVPSLLLLPLPVSQCTEEPLSCLFGSLFHPSVCGCLFPPRSEETNESDQQAGHIQGIGHGYHRVIKEPLWDFLCVVSLYRSHHRFGATRQHENATFFCGKGRVLHQIPVFVQEALCNLQCNLCLMAAF